VAWHHIPSSQRLPERTRGWWEATHLSIGHNTKDTNTNPYQPGGVAIMSHNKVVHQIARSGKDPTGLERFFWTTYQGKQPHSKNCHGVPPMQHRKWAPPSTTTALEIPRSNTRTHWTPMQSFLDWFKTSVTGMDHTRQPHHSQYRCQQGYLQPRNYSLLCWVWDEWSNPGHTWTRHTPNSKPRMKSHWWNFHHPSDLKQLMQIP